MEPRSDVLHGPPGTGKSLVLALLRELFELLGWTHGTQFIYVAFLNSVAAACGGETVHHWSGIPIDAEGGSQDMQRFALKLQAMRVIVLDEFSNGKYGAFGQARKKLSQRHARSKHI